MKKLILTLILGLFATLLSAQEQSAFEGQSFGEGVKKGNVIQATQVEKKLGKQVKAEMKVQGEVVTVCKQKGCFVKLKTANNETMHVKFKDYAFFLPKDIEGKTIVIDGIAEKKVTSVAELKHFAEDAKKSPEEIAKITKPKKEIVFEAKGVVILD